MDFIYSWLGIALFFIIIELLTATFYGLSLALAAAVTALYVLVTGETDFTLIQGVVFMIASALFAYFLPRILISQTPDKPQGSDQYIGVKRSVKKVGEDLKISLDGVDYLFESDE
jgi:membrane protein implicated in regulation of membrane protease activity